MKELLKGTCPTCKQNCNFKLGVSLNVDCDIYSDGEIQPFMTEGVRGGQIFDCQDFGDESYMCAECYEPVGQDYVEDLVTAQMKEKAKTKSKKIPKWKQRAEKRKKLKNKTEVTTYKREEFNWWLDLC
jgi:hypothetical protein